MLDKPEVTKADEVFAEKPEAKRPEGWRLRGSLFWPLLLVALGIVFLLAQMDYIQGDVWSLIVRLWPILLIGGGIDGLLRREGVAGPGFWAAAGTLLLLANLELVPWNAWTIVTALWPLIIVAIGLEIMTSKRSFWLGLAALVVLVAVMLGSLALLDASGSRGEPISQAAPDSEQANIVLKPIVGTLHVKSGTAGGNLVEGKIPAGANSSVSPKFDSQTGTLTLERSGDMIFLSPRESAAWDLNFTPDIPLSFDTEMAVGRADFDLTGLQVEGFELQLPVGTARIVLPAGSSFEGAIELPMGNLEIVVPAGVGLRVTVTGGIHAVDVPDGYDQNDGVYTSPGFDTAETQIVLTVEMGMGRLAVTEK